MTDILNFLRAYPDDPTLVMSKARVAEVIAEIERLRAELAAERVQHKSIHEMLCKEVDELEAERDALRANISSELDDAIQSQSWDEVIAVRDHLDAALEKGGGDE